MSSIISAFGSANISLCEGSSAQMTNYTSFSDYETPLMTPHQSPDDLEEDNSNISETPSTDYNKYLITTKSSSTIQDKTEPENKFATGIKSDSFIAQQNQAINDFMDDVFRVQEKQKQGEPNLVYSGKDSLYSEFFPATQSFKDDVKSTSESDSIFCKPQSPRNVKSPDNLTETKDKIIENLSQMTSDKLFTKHRALLNERNVASSKVQSKIFSNSSLLSQRSRRSRRSTSIDSILRIDCELQPLNFMLSKLLAEFRAVELKNKIEFSDTSVNRFNPCWNARSVKSVAVGGESIIPLNKDYQDYLKYKEEKDAFLEFLKERAAREKLKVEHSENYTQTSSRSCGDCYPDSWEPYKNNDYYR